ncbi:MAG TPA: ABC transporter permease subunit [Tepidisphaeraceae bacterium]|jgi:hypothetical protein
MRSLIWKEWREQSWKIGFSCVVLGAFALVGLRSRVTADETLVMWVCFIGVTMLPVLASSGLVPAERSEHSFESLLALPISARKILLAKVLMGVVLCIVPLVVAGGISMAMAAGREMEGAAIASLYARSILAAILLLTWMMALTIQLPNETRAGLIAVGIFIFWMLATMGLVFTESDYWFALSPFCFIYQRKSYYMGWHTAPIPWIQGLIFQGLICVMLWWWAASRLAGETEEQP